jgi:competence protein ComEC
MIAAHKGEVPLVVYTLPFLAGIFCALFFNVHGSLIPILISCCLCGTFILLNLLYSKFKLYHNQWIGGLLIHCIVFSIGIVVVQQHDDRNYADYFANQNAQHLLVTINNEPTLKGKYWHCSANVIQANTQAQGKLTRGKLLLTIMGDSTKQFKYGDVLLITANYKPVDPPFNPGAFNYKAYLANQHIFEQIFLFPGQYKIVARGAGNPIIAYALELRQRLVQKFKANIKDPDAAAVASTLVLGYKADLNPDVLQAYAKTGTIHVLSVSGAHVAIVFVFINFLLSFLNGSRYGQWIKAIISIILIWGYALLTGFSPAVCRAAVMISMVILGRAGYRYTNSANLLALSAFVLLLYDPLLIADVGFQLSYLAVLGLIMLQPVIFNWFEFENKYVQKFWYYISASLAAQVITFPLSAFYFHQFPLYFLLSNLFIVIPSEVILFSGIIGLLVPQVPVVSKAIFWVLEQTIIIMNKGLLIIEQQPYSSINKIWFTNYDCMALFISVMAFFYFIYNRKVWLLKLSLVCLLFMVASIGFQQIKSIQTQSITFYSLSKHQGILFKNGNQGVLFSDLQPTDVNYKYSIQPCIDSNRVDDVHVANISSNLELPYLKKRSSLIQFLNNRLLIYDPHLQFINLPKKLSVDYVYITGNPHSSLSFIGRSYSYKKLIIDGSNSPQTIKKLVNEADSLHVNYAVLKRNKSIVVTSN